MKSIEEQKASMRNKIILQRKRMDNGKIRKTSMIITHDLLKIPQIEKANNVLLYVSVNGEVNTKYVFERFQKMGSNIFLPAYTKSQKSWVIAKFKGFGGLEKGPFGTMQPRKVAIYSVSTLDLAVVPAVAFSKDLFRLGYGKGVYDRLLGGSNVLKIGLAYDFQIVSNLAIEPHDIKMDIVVTEKKIYTGKSGNI